MAEEVVEMFEIPDLESGIDPHSVEPGEVKLRIVGWNCGEDKNGFNYVMPRLAVIDPHEVGAKALTYYMAIPSEEMDEDTLNNSIVKMRRFCKAFGIPYPKQINVKEDVGMEAWAIINRKEDAQYGDEEGLVNNVVRFL